MNHIRNHTAHRHLGLHGHRGHGHHTQSLNGLWMQVQHFAVTVYNNLDSPIYLVTFIAIAAMAILLLDYLGGCLFTAPGKKGSSAGASGEWMDAAGSLFMRLAFAGGTTVLVRLALSPLFHAGHAAVSSIHG